MQKKVKACNWHLDGDISRQGRIPISTMGGLKARGHPVGATGLYQIVESALQLRGLAGANQIAGARLGLVQNIGGSGATVHHPHPARYDLSAGSAEC